MKYIGPRPWLVDHVDPWIQRLRGPAHKEQLHILIWLLDTYSVENVSDQVPVFFCEKLDIIHDKQIQFWVPFSI